MSPLEAILAMRDLDIQGAADLLDVNPGGRRPISGYGAMEDVEVIDSKARGIRFFLRGGDVVLVYVGRAALPAAIDHRALAAAAATQPRTLRSRQGKRALLHVAAEAGMAWSELDGELGWLELFAPTTFDRYRDEVYREPPRFTL